MYNPRQDNPSSQRERKIFWVFSEGIIIYIYVSLNGNPSITLADFIILHIFNKPNFKKPKEKVANFFYICTIHKELDTAPKIVQINNAVNSSLSSVTLGASHRVKSSKYFDFHITCVAVWLNWQINVKCHPLKQQKQTDGLGNAITFTPLSVTVN